MTNAENPKKGNLQYHLLTALGDLSPLSIIVGAQGRVEMIGKTFLTSTKYFNNKKRGLIACTGLYEGIRVSAFTGQMGGPPTGIALPEAVLSGARIIVRVGSCSSLIEKPIPGDVMIVPQAVRFDGASDNWAWPEFPAAADYRVTAALVETAKRLAPDHYFVGTECSTSDFYNGQGRLDIYGEISERMLARHKEVMRLGIGCYSMEAAALFVWCLTQAKGLPAGAINAVYGNRITNVFEEKGEELASKIALEALVRLSRDPDMQCTLQREIPAVKG